MHLPLRPCAVITTEPNELVAPVHRRMPVILAPDRYDRWLSTTPVDDVDLQNLLRPWPADSMEVRTVTTRVNSVRNDGPACIEPERLPLLAGHADLASD